jgi:hypothetical protein
MGRWVDGKSQPQPIVPPEVIQGKGAVLEETSGSASIDGIGVWVPAGRRPPRGAAGEIDWLLEGLLSRVILAELFSG